MLAAPYLVRLEHFEGPLDLLLHLIRVNELNIFDIDLFTLTTQYLNHLRLVEFRDLNDAAAFLEMASSLVQLKSRELLPKEGKGQGAEEATDDEELTLAKLQQRLLEYDKFQGAGQFLARQSAGQGLTLAASSEMQRLEQLHEGKEVEILGDSSVLLILYEQMLSGISERNPPAMTAAGERLSMAEIMDRIRAKIEQLRFFMVQSLYSTFDTRYDLVIHILALLQLSKDRVLDLYQEENYGPLWVSHKDHTLQASERQGASASLEPEAETEPVLDGPSQPLNPKKEPNLEF